MAALFDSTRIDALDSPRAKSMILKLYSDHITTGQTGTIANMWNERMNAHRSVPTMQNPLGMHLERSFVENVNLAWPFEASRINEQLNFNPNEQVTVAVTNRIENEQATFGKYKDSMLGAMSEAMVATNASVSVLEPPTGENALTANINWYLENRPDTEMWLIALQNKHDAFNMVDALDIVFDIAMDKLNDKLDKLAGINHSLRKLES